MGDRRPAGEKEFNPLDDALDLIGRVMEGQGVDAPQHKMHPLPSGQRTVVPTSVVDLERPKGLEHPRRLAEEEPSLPEREEYVICKFKVPKSDYQRVKRLLAALEEEVVYTTAADNSLNPKTRYNVPLTPSSAGALPWYQLSCSTNSGSWR
jgi:hypothetical protein